MKRTATAVWAILAVTAATHAAVITGITVIEAPGDGWSGVGPACIVNQSGMYGVDLAADDLDDIAGAWHHNGFGISWLANTSTGAMVFDLGQDYTITAIKIFNNNVDGASWQGVSSFTLQGKSAAASSYTTVESITGLNDAGGVGPWGGPSGIYYGQGFDVTDFSARFVKFDNIQSLHAGGNFGLSEVIFIGTPVPEPMTLAMLTIGAVGLMRRR